MSIDTIDTTEQHGDRSNEKQNLEKLRSLRDAALASLHAATEHFDAALAASSKAQTEHQNSGFVATPPEAQLKLLVAQIAALEAEDALRAATLGASAAVDAVEVAEGDELMTSCDARTLRDGLSGDLRELAEIRAQASAVEQRFAARRDVARVAWQTISARRAASALPPPTPRVQDQDTMGHPIPHEAFMRVLDERLANGCASSPSDMRQLRHRETELRATIEWQRRGEEAVAAEREARKKEKMEEQSKAARAAAALARANASETAAQEQEKADLVAAHRQREEA